MKKIAENELFESVKGFLKAKGVQLEVGAYTRRIEKGCGVLTKAINMTQAAVKRTKVEVGSRLEQVRQTIHEKTAPKAEPTRPPVPPPPAAVVPDAKPAPSTSRKGAPLSRKPPLRRPVRKHSQKAIRRK